MVTSTTNSSQPSPVDVASTNSKSIAKIILANTMDSSVGFTGVAAAFAHSIINKGACGPLMLPNAESVKIISTQPLTPGDGLGRLARIHDKNIQIGMSICGPYAYDTDILTPEGQDIFRSRVVQKFKKPGEKPDVVIVGTNISRTPSRDQAVGLCSLAEQARSMETTVIMYVSGFEDVNYLKRLIAPVDTVHISRCTPDADDLMAFKIWAEDFGSLWMATPDEYMVSLPQNPDMNWKAEKFSSDDPTTRKMVRLYAENKTYEEIAALMGVNKSTVSRRLEKVRIQRRI
ncbi:sigma factor-like helix-turn-helix DNA-binding protein [uncultured Herbaspirillum sp.]|uniref:sigma factor-like helix-turn-helix DNA-binding protein n=1 Tax=uncultured Herbaspirillum sp. TaxID=160236 RepID=UPI0026202D64|nr:sigma factor-like helix-turn-helix DNA-binding protein [uncultured Herbaspirillum sp.]